MPRQNLLNIKQFETAPDQPAFIQPVELLKLLTHESRDEPEPKKNRDWEKKNRSFCYRVPAELAVQARDINAILATLAAEYMTTNSSVAAALMSFSLSHLRAGKLQIEGRPKVHRRNLSLDWSELTNGWPRDVRPTRRAVKKADPEPKLMAEQKHIYIGYRWGQDLDTQAGAISRQTGVPAGEVVVYLLMYAIQNYKAGKLGLTPKSVTVSNHVTPTWESQS